jgi:putative phage-type endonuclease
MIILDIEQYSEEWFAERSNKPTASNFDKIVTSKGEPSKQSTNYLYQLAGEGITGIKTETYQSPIMQRGLEMEAEAKNLFRFAIGEVKEVGLIYPDEEKKYSCSPDGFLEDAGLEIKCPLIHTHVSYLLSQKLPTEYVQQVQGSMLVTGFKKWFFMSYYPALPPLIIEVKRDEKFIDKLRIELDSFCNELVRITCKLKEMSA